MTIRLPAHIESSIQSAVHRGRFRSVDEAMTQAATLLLQELDQELTMPAEADQADRPIWDQILEMTAAIPDEEFDRLPADLAEQHDHYIYGTRKRPPSP